MSDLEEALDILRKEGKDKPALDDIYRVISKIKADKELQSKAWSDEDFREVIKSNNYLSDTTKKLYYRNLVKIQRDIWDTTLWNIIMHPEEYAIRLDRYMQKEGRIYETLSPHSRDAYVVPLCSMMTHSSLKNEYSEIYGKWDNLYKESKKVLESIYNTNKPTGRQEEAYVEWSELIKVRDSLPVGSLERLLLMMYTEIPPRRLDYYALKIYEDEPKGAEGNYYIRSTGTLVVQEYKTSRKYGVQSEELPEVLKKEIDVSLREKPRTYLLGERSREGYGRWANGVLRTLFEKNVTITTLRHIYISRRDLKLESKSGLEQEEISSRMGHSRMMQNRYSWHSRECKDIKEKEEAAKG